MGMMIIDGMHVEFTDEANVLDVIRKAGIDLPTLCYVSELSVYGACRLCTVKDDEGRYFASCTVKPRDGMNIQTNTPELHQYRRLLVELLLAAHDRDCTTCHRNGSCHLQELAERMGMRHVRFKSLEEEHPVDLSSNCIVRDPNKCILCGDCIRMCDNVQSVNAIDFAGKGVSSNLTSQSATLYRSDSKTSAYDKVAVRQDMLVEKTLEQRAAETAEMILKLRKQRLQIVTGDTDATYSGEAMGAAIAEMTRLEEEYMMLFAGYSEYQTQKMRFEVIPDAANESNMYVAFRLSDTVGLVPADNLSGKPVIMEIVPQTFADPTVSAEDEKNKKEVLAYYRIPAVCTVRLMDGANLLLQSRMPIYQLGRESSLPVNVILK